MDGPEEKSEVSESNLPNARKRPIRRFAEMSLSDGKYQNPLSPHERVRRDTGSTNNDDG